jgi:hypothetical protein
MKELSITLPSEVTELAVKVSDHKQAEVQTVLNQIFTGTDDWERQVDAIEVKGIEDNMSIQLAEAARKNSKQARLSAEKIFDNKRKEVQTLKSEYDLEDKLWLKAKQVMQLKFKSIEEKAQWKAEFVKRFESEQKELTTQKRIIEVNKYSDINRFEFENMSNDIFDNFINGLKSSYELKIAEDLRIENERIEKAKAEEERIELQRIENERLKKEADLREQEIENERIEVKKKEQLRILAEQKEREAREEAEEIERAKQYAILQKERIAKLKLESELKAKQDAEIKAKQDAEQKEREKQESIIEASKAPVKEKLTKWVDEFIIADSPVDAPNPKAIEIVQKFEAFKNWAKNEIKSI